MRVLFLQLTFPAPDKRPDMYGLFSDLVFEFKDRGHDVHVATLLEKREGKETYLHTTRGVKVLYVKCGNHFDVGIFEKGATILSLPRRFMAAIRQFFGGVQFDLVIYPTPPITFAPLVRKLKREFGCSSYLILRDIFPQNARDLGIIKDPLTFSYFRMKERHLYDLSDYIGCMSRGNIDYVLRHNRVDPAKLEVLYNWEKVPAEQPPADPEIRRKYNLEGKFVAVFGGNIGPAQELEFLLELAKLYRDRPDIVFLIVGKGTEKRKIAEIVEREKLSNVVMHDIIPRDDFNQLLRTCDVGLINLDHRFTIPNIPSKTQAYFGAGIPILAALDRSTDYGKLLEDCQAGLWSLTGDLPAYQRNFEKFLNDPELRRRMGNNGRRALVERFTVERAYDTIIGHFAGAAVEADARRIVLVCQTFYPDSQAVSQLYTQLLREMGKNGKFRLTVLSGYPSRFREGEGQCPRYERYEGIEIHRLGLRTETKRNLVTRGVSYASFAVHAAWHLIRAKLGKRDLVVGLTSPPFMAVLLWIASLIARFRYHFMFMDVYPEGLFPLGALRPSSFVARVWKALNRWSYRRAEKLIVLGRDMGRLLRGHYGVPSDRIRYLPHWSVVDGEQSPAQEGAGLANVLGLDGKFIVQYSGNMGLWHDMDTFVRAAHRLKNEKDIQFLFIGGGIRRANAEALARSLGVTNIIWRDFVKKGELKSTLACCHVSLVSLRSGLSGVAVPSKIYGILSSGRPIIAQVPADSEVGLVVREEQCGIVVEPGKLEQLVDAIRGLRNDPQLRETMAANAYRAYKAKYTLERAAKAFTELWDDRAEEAQDQRLAG